MKTKLNAYFFPFILIIFTLVSAIYIRERSTGVNPGMLTINKYQLAVEVADNDTARIQGLSDRPSLPKNRGMLFIFPKSSYYYFWMKDMKFPLDFIWINRDKVVDLTQNVAKPESGEKLKTFTSGYPAEEVLEINSGVIRSLGIKIGDSVKLNQ